MDLLDLPPIAVRLVGDQQTHSTERQVEVALDTAAVSGVAPRLLQSMVRRSRTERGTGEIPFHLTFSPVAQPRELSVSLGRTAHTSERFWVAIEFIELRPGVAHRDLWKAWELLSAEGAKAPQERQHGRPPPLL